MVIAPPPVQFPRLAFDAMPLGQALETLSSMADAQGMPVNIVRLSPKGDDPKVTISLRNVNLDRALHYVAQSVGFTCELESDAVVLRPSSQPGTALRTEFFALSRSALVGMAGIEGAKPEWKFLDGVTLNGWAEPRQGLMVPPLSWPDLLKQLTDYAKKQLGCPLGLHVYTTGDRSPTLRDWIAKRFDMIYVEPDERGVGAYCLADPRVEQELTANLVRYVRDHDVAMYYYDWGAFNCPAGDHRGHMPGYGTEAIADAFIRQLEAMRAARSRYPRFLEA